MWIDQYFYKDLNEKWELEWDWGLRFQIYQRNVELYNLRGAAAYNINRNLQLISGFVFQYNNLHNENTNIETRPWQAIKLKIPISGNSNLTQQLKLEERIQNLISCDQSRFILRLRYEISTVIPIGNRTSPLLYIPLSEEVLANVHGLENVPDHLINANRVNAGIGYRFRTNYKVELVYARQSTLFQQTESDRIATNIYRVKWKVTM